MEGYMALMIPILALSIPVIAIWTRHQQKMAEFRGYGATFDDGGAVAAHNDKIRALEDRVKVLERIVTDANQGTALAAQIDALRDDAGVPLAFAKERA